MSEALEYNNQSYDHKLFCKNWATHDVLQIREIIGKDGEILQFAQFKRKYQGRRTILDYHRLVYNIPHIYTSEQLINNYKIYDRNELELCS